MRRAGGDAERGEAVRQFDCGCRREGDAVGGGGAPGSVNCTGPTVFETQPAGLVTYIPLYVPELSTVITTLPVAPETMETPYEVPLSR